MTNFIFSGLKHSGKSTHGRLFAESRKLDFFDLDDLIESKYLNVHGERLNCRSIYIKHGKKFFRDLENRTVEEFLSGCDDEPFVLALGGGIAYSPEAMLVSCSAKAVLVYIKAPVDVLLKRILKKEIPPFISEENPEEDFRIIYRERSAFQEKSATVVIEVQDMDIESTQLMIQDKLKEY